MQESDERRQRPASRSQRSDIGGLRSGSRPISDLPPLTSVMDDFYDFNDLNGLNDLNVLNVLNDE